ncbi:MAG: retropepsin-like aspartic protease [Plesiomonas shigelloides]
MTTPQLGRANSSTSRDTGEKLSLAALIDFGAAGNFMSGEFVQTHNIRVTPCVIPLAVEAIDGRPLGEGCITRVTEDLRLQVGPHHHELIQFHIIHSSHHALILGLPWLQLHNQLVTRSTRSVPTPKRKLHFSSHPPPP